MQEDRDLILEQALQKLSHGEDFNNILNQYPVEYRNDLQSELKIVSLLSAIPKNHIPTPTKQYRYAKNVNLTQQLFSLLKGNKIAAFAAVFALILTGGYSTLRIAENSLPNEKLYGLKLLSEEARLNLTFDQEKVASLHLALAEKRLDETKRVIEINNPEQEVAAINALTKQTEKTFNAVSQIATSKAVSQNDSSLLNNLVAINKEQKSVLEAASKSESTQESATVALSANKEINKSLAKIIATVNEQALLDLPNKISITGEVNSYSKTKLVVEKNTFTINDATIIIDSTGEIVNKKFDKIEGKITVIGTKDNNSVLAKKIIVIDGSITVAQDKTDKPQVKGTSIVTKSEPKPSTNTTTTSTSTNKEDETSTILPQKPTQAQAGFIIEPNTDQYAP